MSEDKRLEIERAYKEVFDETGCVRACGRKACSTLITLLQPYAKESLGDPSTGFMHVAVLVRTYKRLMNLLEI